MTRMIRSLVGTVALLLFSLAALAGERVETIVHDLHVNGYPSVTTAIARLQAAENRPGPDAPLTQRHFYFAALGGFSSMERRPAMDSLTLEAMAALEQMATREGCQACRLDLLLIQGQRAISRRDITDAEHALEQLEPLLSQATPQQRQLLHYVRGRLYRLHGRFDLSIAESLLSIALADQLGYQAERIVVMNQLVVTNAYLRDYDRALTIARQAYNQAEQLGFRRLMAEIQINTGFAQGLSGRRDLQLQSLNRVLALTENDDDLITSHTIATSNLADFWLNQPDPQKALFYSQKAMVLARQTNDPLSLSYALTNSGAAKAALGQVDAGIAEVLQGIDLAKQTGSQGDLISITLELITIYERAGRWREAFQSLRRVEVLQQGLTRQAREEAVLDLQEKYAAESRLREIERLADANRIKGAELKVQNLQRRFLATLAVALTLIAVLLTQWLSRMRSANRRLSGDMAILAQQSTHDPLTGAFNRRQGHALITQYSQTPGNAPAAAAPVLGIVLLDIDFFKHINDNHGHGAGDQVLVEVTRRLRSLLRERDAVVRWGGEEFLLLLPDSRDGGLPALAGRILQAIGSQPFIVDGKSLSITTSAGCLSSPFASCTDIEALIELADMALYRAKASGRNCAVCLHPASSDIDPEVLGRDLAAAANAGLIALESIAGPDTARTPEPEPVTA